MYVDIKGQLIFFLNLCPIASLFFVNYHFFKKTPMKCFQCFLRGKSIESFIGIFLKVMIQTFFLRRCWTQKIYQIENSGYGQESLGFKILENVCFFSHLLFLVDLPGCDQGRLGNSFLWSNRLTQPFSTFKMSDVQNVSTLKMFRVFRRSKKISNDIFFQMKIFSTLNFSRLLKKKLLEKRLLNKL